MSMLQWIEQATGVSTQVQVQLLCTLLPIWAAGAIHLSKDHAYGVLSACVLGLDKTIWAMGKVKFLFNPQIQARLQTNEDRLAAIEASLRDVMRELKTVKPAGTP